jgi:hypothetical protein
MICKPFDPYASHIPIWNPSKIPWLPGLGRYKPHAREKTACTYAEISKKYWEEVNLRAQIYRNTKHHMLRAAR